VFQGVGFGGLPLPFGKLFSYVAGTSTPQATYVDSTQTTPNTNPVILNANGQAAVWLNPLLTYKFILQDQFGNQIYTTDQVQGSLTAAALSVILTQQFIGAILYPQTAAESAAGVTPVNLFINFETPVDLRRYGQNGTATPDNAALTSALAVLNGTGVIELPANFAGTNPATLPAGVTIIDYRVGTPFPQESTVFLGGGRWISIGGNPKGSYAGLASSLFVTSPTKTTSAMLGTNMVTGDLTAGGGAIAGATYELQTTGALTGIGGNIVQALTGQISIESTGQTLPLVVGVEGGGGIDRASATTSVTTFVSVQGDGPTNVSTSGATIKNAIGIRAIQGNGVGVTNNNLALHCEGDQMFSVGNNVRIENGSGLSTIAYTFTSNSQITGAAGVSWLFGGPVAFNGGTLTAPLAGFGSPSGSPTAGLTSASTLVQTAGTLASLLSYLKTIGLIAA
jgi:hypothetical protein